MDSSQPPVFTIQLRPNTNTNTNTSQSQNQNQNQNQNATPRLLGQRSNSASFGVISHRSPSPSSHSVQSSSVSNATFSAPGGLSTQRPPSHSGGRANAPPIVQEQMQNGLPRLSISLSSLYAAPMNAKPPGTPSQSQSQAAFAVPSSPSLTRTFSPQIVQNPPPTGFNAAAPSTPRDLQGTAPANAPITRVSINAHLAKNKQEFAKQKPSSVAPPLSKLANSPSVSSASSRPPARNSHAGRVRVSVRVRPPFASEVQQDGYQAIVQTTSVEDVQKVSLSLLDGVREFNFDHVFPPNTKQDSVYSVVGAKVVEDVLSGLNGTLMAYGQTGTGKTHTLGMLKRVREQATSESGILPRALNHIFTHVHQHQESDWTVHLGFFQIYMETVQDLLVPSNDNLLLREDPERGFYVDGLEEMKVSSFEEAMQLVNRGLENRVMAPTLMNATSSRSHTVLLARIQRVTRPTETYDMAGTGLIYSRTFKSKLYIVDLAGSERVKKSQSEGARLNEAKAINQSLSALGNVIAALTDPRPKFVPYRDSKLTKILQDSLGGNSSTHLIAAIAPGSDNRDETLSTLTFASRCLDVKTFAMVNEDVDYKVLCMKLQAQITKMEQDFQMRECLFEARLKNTSEDGVGRNHDTLQENIDSSTRSATSFPSEAPIERAPAPRQIPTRRNTLESYEQIKSVQKGLGRLIRQHYTREATLASTLQPPNENASAEDHVLHAERLIVIQKYQQADPSQPSEFFDSFLPELSPSSSDQDVLIASNKAQTIVQGQMSYLEQLIEKKDAVIQQMREELIYHAIEKKKRDDELVNWSFVLRYLLNTNSQLRRELQNHTMEAHKILPDSGMNVSAAQAQIIAQATAAAALSATSTPIKPDLRPTFNGQPMADTLITAPISRNIPEFSASQSALDEEPQPAPRHVPTIVKSTPRSQSADSSNQRQAPPLPSQRGIPEPKANINTASVPTKDSGVDYSDSGSLTSRIRQFDHKEMPIIKPLPEGHNPKTAPKNTQENHFSNVPDAKSVTKPVISANQQPKPRGGVQLTTATPFMPKEDISDDDTSNISIAHPIKRESAYDGQKGMPASRGPETVTQITPRQMDSRPPTRITPNNPAQPPLASLSVSPKKKTELVSSEDDSTPLSSPMSQISLNSFSTYSTSKSSVKVENRPPQKKSTMDLLAELGISSDSEEESETVGTSEIDSALGDILRNTEISDDGSDLSGDLDDFLP